MDIGLEKQMIIYICFLSIPATILSLAGINPPEYMQGKAFLGKYAVKDEKAVHIWRT